MDSRIANWTLGHALLMIVATIAAVMGNAPFLLIWAVTVSIVFYLGLNYQTWSQMHPVGGYANQVTLIRFVLLLFTLAMQSVLNVYVFVALVVVVMIADGIDGYLARKYDQASAFGEVFDMEVDAFLALSISYLIWLDHHEVWWVLIAGLLRYVFALLYRMIGWQRRKRPSMPESKVFAVLFFIALLTPFIMPWGISIWIVTAGCALVTFSFLKEFALFFLARPR